MSICVGKAFYALQGRVGMVMGRPHPVWPMRRICQCVHIWLRTGTGPAPARQLKDDVECKHPYKSI